MKLLLDTHAWLWFYLGDPLLSRAAQIAIVDPRNSKFVSPASYWELAIKVSLGKYIIVETFDELIQHSIFDNGFTILPIKSEHTSALIGMPFHHNDPFDRLMIAQISVEGYTIVSADSKLDAYSITRLW